MGFDNQAKFLEIAVNRLKDKLKTQLTLSFGCASEGLNMIFAPKLPINSPNWVSLVCEALKQLGGEASLSQLYERLASHPRAISIPTWTCTIRRVVREGRGVVPLGRGRYKLVTQ